ncbi:hypothetical protein AB0395_46250 [Streptosporangium sp. NPDC051023]|uniref:hypothetical protein n=1 Tax=Streptosporangium sp. NPDC051023 TaxID=3155410 RepID=UPI00344FC75B
MGLLDWLRSDPAMADLLEPLDIRQQGRVARRLHDSNSVARAELDALALEAETTWIHDAVSAVEYRRRVADIIRRHKGLA